MRRIILRLTILFLTFGIGVTSPVTYRLVKSQYQKSVRKAREAKLRADLFRLRTLIKQYSADRGAAPNILDDLVYAGYIREIPKDPFTGEKYWKLVIIAPAIENPCAVFPETVISMSDEISTEGTSYSKW